MGAFVQRAFVVNPSAAEHPGRAVNGGLQNGLSDRTQLSFVLFLRLRLRLRLRARSLGIGRKTGRGHDGITPIGRAGVLRLHACASHR